MWRERQEWVGGGWDGGGCPCCPLSAHAKQRSSSGLLDVLQVWMDAHSGFICKQISISAGWEEVQQDREAG